MNFLALEEFKERYFPQSRYPSLSTLRRLCERQELQSIKLGKRWYVDVNSFESRGDPLFAKILNAKAA